MKVTKSQLTKIIKEELEDILEEEDVPGSEEYEAEIEAEKAERKKKYDDAVESSKRRQLKNLATPGPRYDRPPPPTRAQLAARKKRDDERKLRKSREAILRAAEWGSMEESQLKKIIKEELERPSCNAGKRREVDPGSRERY